MYAKISRGNPNDVLRNPGLETLVYIYRWSYATSILRWHLQYAGWFRRKGQYFGKE